MKVIGMTGPSGAGKTVVAEMMNLPVINADQVARQMHKDPAVLSALCRRFGADIARDGILNRTLLAARAFASAQDTRDLNAIMHPKILAEIQRRLQVLEQQHTPLCILDAPLLFEGNCYSLCHTTVAVIAARDVRKNRIVERDGISGEMAEQRMAAQPRDDYYIQRCEFVIYNSGDIAALHTAAEEVFQKIKTKFSIGGQ